MRWLACVLLLCSIVVADELRIASAISLRSPLEAIATTLPFDVALTYGSSGQIANQLRAGAPIDVVITASRSHMQRLSEDELIDVQSAVQIARNRLVLIVPKASEHLVTLDSLSDPKVRRIAIGEPNTVPAGEFAMQTLKSLKLDQSLQHRLIFGTNVRQVLDYVVRGEVDAGFVYTTDARTEVDAIRVVATVPEELHKPIEYFAAVSAQTTNKHAKALIDHLLSDSAQAILESSSFMRADHAPEPLKP